MLKIKVGGDIIRTAGGKILNFARGEITYNSETEVIETAPEITYGKAEPHPEREDSIGLAVMQFRTLKTYNGEFGYDWLRLDESMLADKIIDEPAYKITLSGGIENVTEDIAAGKVDIQEYPDEDKAYEALQKEYKQIPIDREPAYTGTESTYFVPYLKLYSKIFSDTQNNIPPHPYEAELGILTEVMEEIDQVEAECDGETEFNDNTLINILIPNGALVTNKTKHDKKDEQNTIKITCNKDLESDKNINFYAYPKGKTSKEDRRLIGRIRLGANSSKVHKEIKTLLIPVKTHIIKNATGKIKNQSDLYLTRILNQTFITPKIEKYNLTDSDTGECQAFFDLSKDPDFQTGGKHIMNGKIYIDEIDPKTKRIVGARDAKVAGDVRTKFLAQKDSEGNLVNEKYKDHFLVFIFGENTNSVGTYGFVQEQGEKNVLLFEINNTAPIIGVFAHEFLHGLGLWHTHSDPYEHLLEKQKLSLKNKKYIHSLHKTDNVMSYNKRLTNIWHWQARIINSDL